ncbi:MAG: response regulator [Thainema sp.]
MRVLLIEDDATTRNAIKEFLHAHNFIVDVAEDGSIGREMAKRLDYDLILLDIVLPGLSGITLCRQLRQQQQTVPIIFLTSRNTLSDKLEGLNAGADDYVVKSSDPQELLARIQVLLRRGSAAEFVLRWGQLSLDPKTRTVTYDQQPISLSRKEFQILELLMRRPNWVLSRQTIIDQVWGVGEDPPTESTVKSHIKAIRRKLKALTTANVIETVYGQGYRLDSTVAQSANSLSANLSNGQRAEPAIADYSAPLGSNAEDNGQQSEQRSRPSSQQQQSDDLSDPSEGHTQQQISAHHAQSNAQSVDSSSDGQVNRDFVSQSGKPALNAAKRRRLQANLQQLWHQAKQTARQRLNTIEQLLSFLQSGLPDSGLLDQIMYIAHKLAGSLGTFGQIEASQAAYQLERLMQSALNTACQGDLAPENSAQNGLPSSHSAQNGSTLHSSTANGSTPNRSISNGSTSKGSALNGSSFSHATLNALAQDSSAQDSSAQDASAQDALAQDDPAQDTLQIDADLITTARQLIQSIRDCLETQSTPLDGVVQSSPPWPYHPPQIPNLLIIDADQELVQSILAAAPAWSIQAAIATDLTTAQADIAKHEPDIILLDLHWQQGKLSGLQLLRKLYAQSLSIPVVVYSSSLSKSERLQAIQLGAVGFVPRPAVPEKVLSIVRQHLPCPEPMFHVLAVDDDEHQLTTLRTYMENEGLQFTGLGQPERLLETLQASQPDLVLLDILMPRISGIELCQILRSDAEYQTLPVVMLTHYDDLSTRQRAFWVGADAVLSKHDPLSANLGQIQAQLNRDRRCAQTRMVDPLTGLVNRCGATRALQQLIAIARQFEQPLSLGVINLDNFQRFNAEYGRAAGDQLLRRFTTFLQQHCPPADVIARWRAEEFVISMIGLERADAVERLAQLLELWRSQPPMSSFSAGVATFPVDGHNLEFLYRVAEAALYQAKLTGRDRILPASWQMPDASDPQLDVVIVGPDTTWLRSLARALETRGYRIHWFQSGQTALEYIDRANASVQLQATADPDAMLQIKTILLTTDLPDISAIELVNQLNTACQRQTPILALIQNSDENDQVEELRSQGMADYISYPCDVAAVIAHIRRYLAPTANC